jgi:hypothetical protein
MSSRMVLALLTILGLVGIIIYMTTAPTNCWDNYQTENDAIMHCEEH